MMIKFIPLMLSAVMVISGCSAIGPTSVHQDRFDYNTALSDSWKEQTLLNIVRLRYADMPIFLEVASIVSGYTLEGSVNITGNVSSEDTVQGDFLSMGTGGKFTDRPTITYAPVSGDRFHQSFMTPIPPKILLFLMESGWPADMVLPLTVDAINGLRGRNASGRKARAGNQDFYRVIRLLGNVQDSGSMALRILKDDNKKETIILFFYQDDIPENVERDRREILKIIGLENDQDEVIVRYGLLPTAKNEIALMTRSMLQMLITLSALVEIPEEHIRDNQTFPTLFEPGEEEEKLGKLINILSSTDKPPNAFVTVKYNGYWFWIDKSDFLSKRTFTFLMVLFSLMESDESRGLPLVTIPAG